MYILLIWVTKHYAIVIITTKDLFLILEENLVRCILPRIILHMLYDITMRLNIKNACKLTYTVKNSSADILETSPFDVISIIY